MSFSPEKIQRGPQLVAAGDEALRAAVDPAAREAMSRHYRPLLMAVAAMLLKATSTKRPAGFSQGGGI